MGFAAIAFALLLIALRIDAAAGDLAAGDASRWINLGLSVAFSMAAVFCALKSAKP